ncbi:winged helix-turn-helix transcriptional regulator [Sphingomonas sp.]|uniref:winged helix-turn-helix transcriptional regulator n=1 Tax=Sphingomonas sp. TaxID=28214 RepID=UPI003AFFC409
MTEAGGERRWYDDACGTALALELVGERWSLLIVRELMFGGRRFGEIKAALGTVSANVLVQRLEGLERAGILARRTLPPPASARVYELTPWGYEAEEAIKALGRWAVRSPAHDPSLPLSPAALMLSFRTMYAGGMAARIGFRIGREAFVADAREAPGDMRIARGDPHEGTALVLTGCAEAIAAMIYGGRPAEEAGVAIEGDRALLARFARAFPLPAKAPVG